MGGAEWAKEQQQGRGERQAVGARLSLASLTLHGGGRPGGLDTTCAYWSRPSARSSGLRGNFGGCWLATKSSCPQQEGCPLQGASGKKRTPTVSGDVHSHSFW